MAALILKNLDIHSVRLLTNNPTKLDHLKRLGVQIDERVPLLPTVNAENYRYLETKVRRLNHLLNLNLMQVELPKRGNGSH
jgi:GTP cyclohydrolase II